MKKLVFKKTKITPAILGIVLLLIGNLSCSKTTETNRPNILFILMDDLGFAQFGVNNDTITTADFDPYLVLLVDSLQGYSLEKSLEFSKTATPTLTALAKNGLLFTNASTSSNLCAPSRLGIATGTLQNRFGIYTNTDCEKSGLVSGTHLAEKIKQQNYATAHIGKWHIGSRDKNVISEILKKHGLKNRPRTSELKTKYPAVYAEIENCGYAGSVVPEQNPLNNGFDYYFGYNNWGSQYYNSTLVWENFKHASRQTGYNTDVFTDKALEFMNEQIGKNKPFYVQLHYHAVHDSIEPRAPEKYFSHFNSGSYDIDNFYAHVFGVDQNVARIISFLKSKKQYKNTLIIFCSDNGAMLGGSYNGNKTGSPLPGNTPFSGHKGNYYLGGFRVPMFISWPAKITKPAKVTQMVSSLDILPTALDAAGAKIPENIDGKSLLPLIKNPQQKVHDYLVWAGIHSSAWGFLITKTTKDHHSERKFAPPAWVVRKDNYLLRFVGTLEPGIYTDFLEGRKPVIELFDITADPAEKNNLALKMPEKVKEMAALYFNEAKDFPPPSNWANSKYEELINSEKLISK